MAPKGKGKGKGPELLFDEKARAEYLTGFRKRKQERKQAGRDHLAKKAKEEQLVARKELRAARKEKAAENVREARKAFGLEGEGESDIDQADGSDDGEGIDEDDAIPQVQEEEYDSDEHHTHVVVESFDPEEEAFAKATSVTTITSAAPRKPKANGQSEETHHPHQEENVSHKRLIISGLTESFSKEDLIRRFSTFGTVLSLDGLGKRDALGQFRPYAYLTLQAPPQQIKRCMNLLSGSVWKGATLRIGEAKPDYQQRILEENQERKQQEEEERANKARKHKRLPPGMGVESSNMDIVDENKVESGLAWGWKRTPAGHLVRPLRMRPAHPLPRPSRASTLARADAVSEQAEVETEAEEGKRGSRVNPRPPTKAHRITIDPTRYGAIHLSGPLLESLASETGSFDVSSIGPGEWLCEEIQDEDGASADAAHRLVRWQYLAKDGAVLHEEFTKLPVRVVHAPSASTEDAAEDVMAQLDFDRYSDAGSDDLFSGFTSTIPLAKPKATKPKAVPTDAVDTANIDDLFSNLPSASTLAAAGVDDLFSDLPSAPTPKRAKVQSQPSTATPSKKIQGTFIPGLDPEEDDPANFSDGYDEVKAVRDSKPPSSINAEEERQKTLALLGEMFGSVSDDELVTGGAKAVEVMEVEAEASDASSESSSEDESTSEEPISEAKSASEVAEEESESSASSSSSESSEEYEEVAPEDDEAAPVEAESEVEDVIMVDEAPAPIAEPVPAPTDARSRRAAFLSSLSNPPPSKQDGSFVPIARFDPGPSTAPPSATPDAPAPPADTLTAPTPAATATPTTTAPATFGTSVSMSTLKEMFRPQDKPSSSILAGLGTDSETNPSGGFSLMDSLGLEFELEEEEPEPESLPSFAPPSYSTNAFFRYPQAPSQEQQEQPKKLSPFFPTTSSNSAAWNGSESQGSVQRWLKPRSEEERERDWERYKEDLTQVIKKRHREAARKHKRGFKSLPQANTASAGAGVSRS